GTWWVQYFDDYGRRHRKKVGPKRLAIEFHRKARNEVFERRHFPERFRPRDVPLAKAIDEYLKRKGSKLRALSDWTRIGGCWKEAPETKGKTLRQVETRDVERYRERRRAQGL